MLTLVTFIWAKFAVEVTLTLITNESEVPLESEMLKPDATFVMSIVIVPRLSAETVAANVVVISKHKRNCFATLDFVNYYTSFIFRLYTERDFSYIKLLIPFFTKKMKKTLNFFKKHNLYI